MRKLTALTIPKIKEVGYHRDTGDGAARGLYLQVTPGHGKAGGVSRSWIYRYVSPVTGKARWMGLGGVDVIGLADARELARACRKQVKLDGADPIERRNAQRAGRRLATASAMTFAQCAERYIEAHKAGWSNAEHARQWGATLANFAYPIIGNLPVAAIDTPLVLKVLEPIWTSRTVTAKRLRGRIENVLDWAKVRGYRNGDNPSRWRGHLSQLLAKPSRLKQVKHHPALPYPEMPAFMADMRQQDSIAARALEVTALTALRTSEVTGATWSEIDLKAKVWTVPAERMKARREHRVPLSDRVVEILRALPRVDGCDVVFADATGNRPLRQHAMLDLMARTRPGFVPHGLRSSFRDWTSETTSHPNHVVEMALAHTVGSAVERSYQRGDLFEKRRRLMADWARYCSRKPLVTKGTNVTALRAGA